MPISVHIQVHKSVHTLININTHTIAICIHLNTNINTNINTHTLLHTQLHIPMHISMHMQASPILSHKKKRWPHEGKATRAYTASGNIVAHCSYFLNRREHFLPRHVVRRNSFASSSFPTFDLLSPPFNNASTIIPYIISSRY